MITHYFRTLKDEKFKAVDSIRTGVWTHAVAPTEEELETLVKEYGLDEAILEDAQDFFEVPRMEREGNALYCFTRYPFDEKAEDIDTAPILIVVGESFVLTVAQREVPFIKSFFDGADSEGEAVYTTQKAKLFIQMMTALTRAYEYELVAMRKSVHRDRTRIRNIRAREIERLVGYEHELNDTIAALIPTNLWLSQVTNGNYLQLFQEDVELMEDLTIDNRQLIDSTKSLLVTIQNIRSASEAIITQNLNTRVGILTALTILLTIPMVIASLYGMNVTLPLSEHPQAFWLVIVLIGTIIGVATHFFIKNRWL